MVLDALTSYRRLPDDLVDKLLRWSCFNFKRSTELTGTFYSWLAVLAENELVGRNVLYKYYSCLQKTMQYQELLPSLCSLLMVTAHPKVVTPRIVELTVKCYERFDKSKAIAALLRIFQQFHPHLIALKLPKTEGWPKVKLKPSLEETFNGLQLKKLSSSCESYKERGLKQGIPEPFYDKEPGNPPYRFTSFSSIKEIDNLSEVALPSNTVSLLQNQVGMYFLSRRPPEELANFSILVGSELREPNENLLDAIYQFQESIGEAVPSVYDSFLPMYLVTWDGLSFRRQILKLVEWIPVKSYIDLRQNFMLSLAAQYGTADLELKVEILQSLRQMITNIVAVQMARAKANVPSLFGTPKATWIEDDTDTTLSNIKQMMHNLIQNGLMIHKMSSYSLLELAIIYHDMISRLEIAHNLDPTTFIPLPICYSIYYSSSCTLINHLCALLVRYKKIVIPYLEERNLIEVFEGEISDINNFSSQLRGFLVEKWEWWDVLPTLLDCISPEQVELYQSQFNTKAGVLNIENHIALAPFINVVSTKAGFDQKSMTPEHLMFVMKTFLKGIHEFITLVDD